MTSPHSLPRSRSVRDLDGRPYTPARDYSWMTGAMRSSFARQFDCDPSEVECRLDARDRMDAYIAERAEDADPYGYRRSERNRQYSNIDRMMNDERTW